MISWLAAASSTFVPFKSYQPSSADIDAAHNSPHSTIPISIFSTKLDPPPPPPSPHPLTTNLAESVPHREEEKEEEAEAQDEHTLTTHSLPSYPPSLFITQFLPPSPSSSSSSSSSSPISYPQDQQHTLSSNTSTPTKQSPTHNPNTSPNTRAATTETNLQSDSDSERFVYVMHIIDKQELAKHVLGLAIPMGMGLVFSSSHLALSSEMHGVAVALCCAFAAIWNGILLRHTFHAASVLILTVGVGFMVSAFYAFVGCFLPLSLKWIPALCCIATLFPLAMFVVAFIRRGMKLPPSKQHNV